MAASKIVRTIPVALLFLVLLLVYMLLWPFNYLVRQWKKQGSGDVPFDDDDSFWYVENEINHRVIDCVIPLSRNIHINELRAHISQCLKGKLKVYPGFLKFLCEEVSSNGIAFWRRISHIELDEYIVEHDVIVDDTVHLMDVLNHYASQGLPAGMSPWRVVLINTKDDKSVILCRVKHSITDGVGLMRLFLEHLVDAPVRKRHRARWENVTRLQRYTDVIRRIVDENTLLVAMVIGPLVSSVAVYEREKNCLYGMELTGKTRISWTNSVALKNFTEARKKFNATINDLVVTAICEGVSKYVKHMQLPPLPTRSIVSLVASLRPDESLLSLKFISFFLICADLTNGTTLEEKLLAVQKECSSKKVHHPIISYYMTKLISILPITDIRILVGNSNFTLAVSNLAGAKSQATISGIPVENTLFLPPAEDTHGLVFSIQSYNGLLTVGLRADEAVLTNPKLLMDFVEESLNALMHL